MRFRLHQPLGEGVGEPLQLLVGTVLRIVENSLLLAIEELGAATIGLRHEGIEEVRKLLGVFIGDRMLHAVRLELLGGSRHLFPGLGHGDALIFEDLLVVDEGDRVGVVRQAVELALVGHVAQCEAGNVFLQIVHRARRRDVVQRRHESGRGPSRQPILTAVDHVGGRVATKAQNETVVIVRPSIVGDLHLDARIGRLELLDIVLDGFQRIVPHHEFQRDVLGQGRFCQESGGNQRCSGQQLAKFHRDSPSCRCAFEPGATAHHQMVVDIGLRG